MTMRYRLAAGFVGLVAGCAVLSGCTTGLPDRTEQVRRLEAEIPALPGVAKFHVSYQNDFESGSSLRTTAYFPTATEPQIVAIAQRITDLTHGQFNGYQQEHEFVVGNRAQVTTGAEPDPREVADRVRRLRQISSALPAAEITWNGRGLDVHDVPEAAVSFAAVRGGLAGKPARVTVFTQGAGPSWEVDFPFDAEQERQLAAQMAGLPVEVTFVALKNGFLSSMNAGVRDPAKAYADLAAAIAALHATRAHPVYLTWHRDGEKGKGLKFAGNVHVAGCQYPRTAGEEDPGRYYTPEALELQRRLRTEFDACR
ncbi:hypothetical protein [Amycolatopsis minnesotensis]|uniref:Lipoprotein n=1 Tax=Amycolatopsis minnesotensis TaxID=337894 RepID=A0ABN2PYK8_9PSEU